MPVHPALAFGLQSLGEAIQLTPVSPAQAILKTANNILQLIDAVRTLDEDRQRLAKQVVEIAMAHSEALRKFDEAGSSPESLKGISDNLIRKVICLETISHALQMYCQRGFFMRILQRSAIAKVMNGCEANLTHIFSLLSIQLQLRNAKLLEAASLGSKTENTEITFERRLALAHQETLDLIQSQVVKQSRKKLQRSSFGHLPPAASPVFFGRSDQVEHLVQSLTKCPSYQAILGPGGIGKTSVALNVLHDPRIIASYGKHRYFLACETTVDVNGIVAGIADIFSLDESTFVKSFKRLCEIINSNMLFLLDNFETPWEAAGNRQKVEELLSQLSDVPNLSFIVTLRGSERPFGIQWSRPFLPSLGPLELEAAQKTFLNISGVTEGNTDMLTLLQEVEGIPLAITLLGAQAQYMSCALLLEQWRNCKTSMVTRGWDSRLSSLDMSISLSLKSSRFTSNAQAFDLLKILSLLPDGATVEELTAMTPDGFNSHASASTLLQVALVYMSGKDRIRALAPIREFVQLKHPIPEPLFEPVLSYYSGLCSYSSATEWTAESIVVEDNLNACVGNINHVLRSGLCVAALAEQAVKSVIHLSSFRRDSHSGSVALLLEDSLKAVRVIQNPLLEAECLLQLGGRLTYLADFSAAEKSLTESISLLGPESSDQLVNALNKLAYVLILEDRDEEGAQASQMAVSHITKSTSTVTCALAYMQLGRYLSRTGNFVAGAEAMKSAASYFQSKDYLILSLRYSENLCGLYVQRDMYSHAVKAANMGISLTTGSERHLAHMLLCHRALAYVLMGQYEDARSDLQESIDLYALTRARERYLGDAFKWLGMVYIACCDFKAASESLHISCQLDKKGSTFGPREALAILELQQSHFDKTEIPVAYAREDSRNCPKIKKLVELHVRGQVLIRRGNIEGSFSTCVLALVMSKAMDDRISIAVGILILGDAYMYIERDVAVANACYLAFLDLMRYIGMRRAIANVLMRLGVTAHLQGGSALARRRLNQAIRFYRETQGDHWAEFCAGRLRAIESGIVEENMPFFPPVCYYGF